MYNIRLLYTLTYLSKCWFWMGIWIFYYLRFTNYSGIGLLESVMIITTTVAEIPTGVIADLIGKKKALTLSFFLSAIGNLIMALAPNFPILLLSVFTMTVGGSLYSGTKEAMMYDSLKEAGKEDLYEKSISRTTTIECIA